MNSIKNKLFFICLFIFIQVLNSQNSTERNIISTWSEKMDRYAYKNSDSVYYYANQIIKKIDLEDKWTENINTRFKTCRTALYFHNFKTLKTNLKSLDSIFNLRKNEIDTIPYSLTYQNLKNYYHGFYHYRLNNYKESIEFFNKTITNTSTKLDNTLTKRNISELARAYSFVAKMYVNEGKYNLAKQFYNKAIDYLKANEIDKNELYPKYNLLAEVLTKEGNYKESNNYLLKTLNYDLSKNSSNAVISSTINIIKNHNALSEEEDSANYYHQFLIKYIDSNHKFKPKVHEVNAEILTKSKNLSGALIELNNSLALTQKLYNNHNHPEISLKYMLIGNLYANFNKRKKAIENYNLGLNQFSNDSINSTINQTIKFKILKEKADALNKLKNYNSTIEDSDLAISILDSLKPTFRTNTDKLFLIENAFPLFENGIEAAYQLHHQTNDSKYIDKAFLYMEKSKSTLLLESLLSSQGIKFANVPEDLVEKEKQLKAKITYLEKRINKKSTSELQDEIFDLKQDRRNLIKNIELNYKKYYDLKYNTQVLSLQELQGWLDEDTILISYFYGNDNLYSITVTKNSKQFEALKIDTAFETLLKDAYSLLSNPKSDLKLLKTKTHRLYQKLVKKSLAQCSKEKLIVIPDGLLKYMPFGSLSVNNDDYLIQNQSISYANSVTLLNQLKIKEQYNNQVLAFAPNFDNSNTSTLLPLPNNVKEVKQLLSHFKGEVFIDNEASLKNFNSENKDFGIIHLATHAILDDENPEYSYLAFSPNSQTENLLYTNDLYNLELNANMVTLSACESGIGDLKRGEGMLSLARGFYFSGTSSITSTLWKLNDASSSLLMDGFYNNLSKGNTKDIALKKAKINFININKDNALSHPYFWSGFIISGNTNALVPAYKLEYIALVILVLITLGYILYKKKRTN